MSGPDKNHTGALGQEVLDNVIDKGENWRADTDEKIEAGIKSAVFIPLGLQLALETNPTMKITFFKVVPEAVRRTFLHPDTSVNVITEHEIRLRTEMALHALDTMYNDKGLSLHQSYDRLLPVLINALRMAKKVDDVVDTEAPQRWHKES